MEIKSQDYAISPTVKLGKGVVLARWTNLYNCEIGDECQIGPFVEIQAKVRIGPKCKISSHTFVCEGVFIGARVFIGHGVVFTNDRFPLATNSQGQLKKATDWKCEVTVVEDGASIGSGSTILPGVRIGPRAIVGAGSVVTKNVPSGATVAGNPARIIAKKAL